MRKTLFAFLLWALVLNTYAQNKTGSISGTIKTTDGEPAADVSVVLKNTSKGSVTSSDGSYEIKRIPSGNYTAEISLVGFSTITREVSIRPGQQVTLDFHLTISSSELIGVTIRSGKNAYVEQMPSKSLRLQGPLLKAPQNIQVVTEKVLNDQQVYDMSEGVTRNVSGASSIINESWGNYANLSMRGGSIAAFRNGMNVKMPWGPLLEDMSMVEKIEFVKGPAGFMLANGEPTGFYNIVTKKPTGITRGKVGLGLGSFQTYRATLDLDGKLSDDGKFLYRFNMMGQMRNFHRDFDFNNRFSIAPVVTYQFNDKTSLTAEYTYQQMKMAMLGSAYVFSPKLGDLPRDFTNLEPNLEPTTIKDHSLFVTFNHQLDRNWSFTTKLAYLNYSQTGSSMWPAYPDGLSQNGDLSRSVSIWDVISEQRLGQAYVNGKISTGPLTHTILAGVDMTYKEYNGDFYQSFNLSGHDIYGSPVVFNIYDPVHGLVPPADLPAFDRSLPMKQRGVGRLGESSSSLYVQDEIGFLNDRLRLTLAGRQTKLKQDFYETYSNDNAFTPRVGASFSLDKSSSVYALYDRTFVAQQGLDSFSHPFVPVTGNNVEAGIKKDWSGGRWTSGLSIYRITRNNVVSYIPGPEFKAIQTGQTKTRGVELDVKGEISRSFSIIMTYAYTTSEVTEDEDESKVGGPLPGPSFPKHITNTWLTYRAPDGKFAGFGASLGYQYQGERQNGMNDYFRVDGNVYWQNDQVSISLNANNIFNKYLYSGAPYEYDNDPLTTEYFFQMEPGINFRLGVGYKF